MKTKEKNIENVFRIISNLYFMVKLMFLAAPKYVVFRFIVYFLTNLPADFVAVVGVKFVIDSVQNDAAPLTILLGVGGCLLLFIIGELFNDIFFELFAHRERERLHFGIRSKLYEKARELDLSSYDNPEFYNDFMLSIENTSEYFEQNFINAICRMAYSLFAVVSVSAIVFTIDPICSLIIIVSAVVFSPLGRKIADLQMQEIEADNEANRKVNYFQRLFYLPEYTGEIRSNRIFPLLMKRYTASVDEVKTVNQKYLKKIYPFVYLQTSGAEILGIMFTLSAYIGYRAIVKQDISTGDFVATFNSAAVVANSVFMVLIYGVRNFNESSKLIGKMRVFLNTQPKIKGGEHIAPCSEPETIKVEGLKFSYQDSEANALNGVDLEIKPYEKVALVGYNGAGKTTLTNLLLRLYDANSGTVKIGGRDIREETLDSHRNRFAVVFQDFAIFAGTIGENVAMSTRIDKERVLEALKKAGFNKELPDGADTVLLREFNDDGLLLSGGEAQKIAIARAFYKQCPYVILDEPSANLDPVAEYELNNAILTKAQDKTVIIISHRLSTAKNADRIIMLDNGRVIENGSHDELMKLGGKYAEMFNLQAEKYSA